MAIGNNTLVNVATLCKAQLMALQNFGAFVANANNKFVDFQNRPAQLGGTVQIQLPWRISSREGLVADFQGLQQRFMTLSIDKSRNSSFAFTDLQYILNAKQFMDDIGRAPIVELGSFIENDIASVAITSPYRFYGDGYTELSSFNQVSDMLRQFRSFGFAQTRVKVIMSDVANQQIVGSGLNQFVPSRNDTMANSWDIGSFDQADFYWSNILQVHYAGTAGNQQQALTVISTNDPTGNFITQIKVSGGTNNDANAIKLNDKIVFVDNVGSLPNMRFRSFTGHIAVQLPVQMRATADSGANSSGQIIINIDPPLCVTPGNPEQNIVNNVVAGMQLSVKPTHRAGMVWADNALFVAMPKLPEQKPFDSASVMDPMTGVSLRLSTGSNLVESTQGSIVASAWGKNLQAEYGLSIIHPY